MSAQSPLPDHGASPARARPRRLVDHLAVLTSHWVIFLVAFLTVFGTFLAIALLKTASVTATAAVELSNSSSGGRFLPSMGSQDAAHKLENEVAAALSLDLARAAAADKAAHLTCVVEEQAIHRVLDLFLRSINRGREPCLLEVTTPDKLPEGEAALEQYLLQFDLSGEGLAVTRLPAGDTERVLGFTPKKEFGAFGRRFAVGAKLENRGSVAGRAFLVSVRSYESAARWIHKSAQAFALGRESDMLRIGFTCEDPELARNVADTLARAYIARGRERYHEELQAFMDALKAQIGEATAALLLLENARDAFVQKNDAVYLTVEKVALLSNQPKQAADVVDLERALKVMDQKHEELMKLRGLPLAESMDELLAHQPDPLLQSLWTASRDLSRQRNAILKAGVIKEAHADIVKIDVQIAALEDEIRAGLERLFRLAQERHERERVSTAEQLERAKAALVKTETRLGAIPGIERELSAMQRRVDAKRSSLDGLLERQTSLQLLESSNHSPVRLVEQALATTPETSLLKGVLLALLLGLAAGGGAAIGRDALSGGLRTPEEVEDLLRIPVYAAVPDFRTAPRAERAGVRNGLIALQRPRSGLAECYWQLRAKFLFMGPERRVRCLAVTSAMPFEGKTVTVLNLAGVLAQAGARVVVVDADMRRPQCHKHLGLPLAPGLGEVLEGGTSLDDAVRPTRYESVSLLPAGTAKGNPGRLLDGARVTRLIEGLKQKFDLVLVDLPPVLAVADAAGAMRAFDGVLQVVRSRKAHGHVLEEAKRELELLGARVLGAVFNAYDMRRSKGRGYGYGRYLRDEPEAEPEAQAARPVRLKHVDGP